jgi:hypothetical protein
MTTMDTVATGNGAVVGVSGLGPGIAGGDW